MQQRSHLTIGEIASLYDQPQWRVRRCVDALDVEIPRAGQYRLVPKALLVRVAIELAQRGWLPDGDVAADHVKSRAVDRQDCASPSKIFASEQTVESAKEVE